MVFDDVITNLIDNNCDKFIVDLIKKAVTYLKVQYVPVVDVLTANNIYFSFFVLIFKQKN